MPTWEGSALARLVAWSCSSRLGTRCACVCRMALSSCSLLTSASSLCCSAVGAAAACIQALKDSANCVQATGQSLSAQEDGTHCSKCAANTIRRHLTQKAVVSRNPASAICSGQTRQLCTGSLPEKECSLAGTVSGTECPNCSWDLAHQVRQSSKQVR